MTRRSKSGFGGGVEYCDVIAWWEWVWLVPALCVAVPVLGLRWLLERVWGRVVKWRALRRMRGSAARVSARPIPIYEMKD